MLAAWKHTMLPYLGCDVTPCKTAQFLLGQQQKLMGKTHPCPSFLSWLHPVMRGALIKTHVCYHAATFFLLWVFEHRRVFTLIQSFIHVRERAAALTPLKCGRLTVWSVWMFLSFMWNEAFCLKRCDNTSSLISVCSFHLHLSSGSGGILLTDQPLIWHTHTRHYMIAHHLLGLQKGSCVCSTEVLWILWMVR